MTKASYQGTLLACSELIHLNNDCDNITLSLSETITWAKQWLGFALDFLMDWVPSILEFACSYVMSIENPEDNPCFYKIKYVECLIVWVYCHIRTVLTIWPVKYLQIVWWNELSLSTSDSLSLYKKRIKTHFFNKHLN